MVRINSIVGTSVSANLSVSTFGRPARLASTALALALACTSGIANAQNAENGTAEDAAAGEIIVTAQRRSESILETPLAVSVVGGEAISQTARTDISSILEQIPSVQYQTSPDGLQIFAIRGIGTDGPNKEPSVAQYEDGVTLYRQTNLFHDVARIEVLRGPQGTLYGGSATGGAVNIITNDPKLGETQVFAQAGYGNYDALNLQGVLNAPLGESVGLRIAGTYNRRDPYFANGDTARDGFNLRGKLRYNPSETFDLVVGAEFSRETGIGDGQTAVNAATGKPTSVNLPRFGFNLIETYKFFARADVDLGFATLTYIPAYQHRKFDNGTFLTGVPATGGNASGRVLTQELRLTSPDSSPIKWIVGAYYYELDQNYNVFISAFTPAVPVVADISVVDPQHNNQIAAFGQVTVPLGSRFRVTGGLRYSRDKIDHPQQLTIFGFTTPVTQFQRTYNRLDYLVRAEADFGPDTLAYATVSSGYRPGNTAVGGKAYDNETVTSYEAGLKTRLLDNSLTLSAAVFYNDYANYQVASAISCGPNCNLADVSAIPSKMAGFEFEAQARPSPNDTLDLNFSYLDTKLKKDVSIAPVLGGPATVIATGGAVVPHAPKWRVNASYQHDFAVGSTGKLFVRGEVSLVSSQVINFSGCYYSPASCTAPGPFSPVDTPADFFQSGYVLANASIGYTTDDGRFSIVAYARNLGNERIKINFQTPYADLAAPRTYGVTISTRW